MGLWTLFVTASIPVLESFLITALGSYLALDRVNLLGEDSRKHLNTIVFYIFTPCLIGANLAETITYESMIKLWFMPINILFTFIVGSILGWALVRVAKPPPHQRGLVVGCCAADHSYPLSLSLSLRRIQYGLKVGQVPPLITQD